MQQQLKSSIQELKSRTKDLEIYFKKAISEPIDLPAYPQNSCFNSRRSSLNAYNSNSNSYRCDGEYEGLIMHDCNIMATHKYVTPSKLQSNTPHGMHYDQKPNLLTARRSSQAMSNKKSGQKSRKSAQKRRISPANSSIVYEAQNIPLDLTHIYLSDSKHISRLANRVDTDIDEGQIYLRHYFRVDEDNTKKRINFNAYEESEENTSKFMTPSILR